jgi:hypothetical protein
MVDTQDLKSCDHNGCAGSSPAPGTKRDKRSFSTSSFFELPKTSLIIRMSWMGSLIGVVVIFFSLKGGFGKDATYRIT